MTTTLQKHPIIGVIAGFGSSLISNLSDFFTNSSVLKIASLFGFWVGILIAVITLVLKSLELIHVLQRRYRNWRQNKQLNK